MSLNDGAEAQIQQLIDRLQFDPQMQRAAAELGLNIHDLAAKPKEDFVDKGTYSEVINLRYTHAQVRRRELADALRERYAQLQKASRSETAKGATPSSSGPSEPPQDKKVAAEARRLAMLAKRREEEVAKMVEFQLSQRAAEQEHEEAREQELRRVEKERRQRQKLMKERMEQKRRQQEAKLEAERAAEAEAEVRRNAELARERERMRQEALRAARAKKDARLKEEEQRAAQARRQAETKALFEAAERRVQERAALAEERKAVRRAAFEQQQREARRAIAERQEAARARIASARQAQDRMADEARRAYEDREQQIRLKKEEEARQHAEQVRQQRERQLAMALRRGKVFEKMRNDEQQRVVKLVDKLCSQEAAMEEMAKRRRLLAAMRDEQHRLRQQDRQDNIARMARAKAFHNEQLQAKFAAEDAKEAERRMRKKQLVEEHRAIIKRTFCASKAVICKSEVDLA